MMCRRRRLSFHYLLLRDDDEGNKNNWHGGGPRAAKSLLLFLQSFSQDLLSFSLSIHYYCGCGDIIIWTTTRNIPPPLLLILLIILLQSNHPFIDLFSGDKISRRRKSEGRVSSIETTFQRVDLCSPPSEMICKMTRKTPPPSVWKSACYYQVGRVVCRSVLLPTWCVKWQSPAAKKGLDLLF